VDGFVLDCPSESLISQVLASGRGWDTILVPILDTAVLDERPLIVEVGSNFGASLLQMIRAKPEGRFVCFEPSRYFGRLLQRNVERNGWLNVEVEAQLLGDRQGVRTLHRNVTTASAAADEYDGHRPVARERVTETTLDAYFAHSDRLAFLKIDTDGYEHRVLRGAQTVLERDRPVLFLEFDPPLLRRAGDDEEAMLELLAGLGYETALVFSNYGEALEVVSDLRRILEIARSWPYLDLLSIHESDGAGPAALADLAASIAAAHSLRSS